MRFKKIISILLLFTLLVQVLPVKQVGYILFSNQINEEIPHGMDVCKKSLPADNDLHNSFQATQFLSAVSKAHSFAFYSTAIPANYTGEVPTPPPNI